MDVSAYLARCLNELKLSIAALGGDSESPKLPGVAALIIQSMTGEWRSFHTPDHIFEVGAGGSPTEVIAALFHDLVYVQVDSGINLNLARYLTPFVLEDAGALRIQVDEGVQDPDFEMCLSLFGFSNGQTLSPFAGQNEFLSALVAVKALKGILSLAHLVKIAACIEATIPFRGPVAPDKTCSQQLAERLHAISAHHGLHFSTAEIDQVVMEAVSVANRDVGNFASEDPADFLSNTWNLIPETNHELAQVNVFTVQGYRNSLQKMEGFLSFLQPSSVFRQYLTEPQSDQFLQMQQNCQINLEVARLYLRAKLISIGILEALSARLGRSTPLSSLMGKLPHENDKSMQLETHLPKVAQPYQAQTPHETLVIGLLHKGRSAETHYDVKHSPVADYMVQQMGFERMMALLEPSRAFFKDPEQGPALLVACDPVVLAGISNGVRNLYALRAESFS
jgi:hypothetical protein